MKDEQGEWDQAIDAIARCKQVQMAHEEFHWNLSETAHERMRQLIATVTRDDLRRWREAAEGFAPCHMALLTGFPRSGTTLLEQVLDAHPDVVSSEERDFIGKELFLTVIGRRVNTPLLELLN